MPGAQESETVHQPAGSGVSGLRRGLLVAGLVLALLPLGMLSPGQARSNVALSTPPLASAATTVPSTANTNPKSVRLRVRKAQAAGTEIAWAKIGKGRPLLLLNGTGSPMAQWDPALLAGLAQRRQVIVFDYPGLGESGSAPTRITFPAMADWIADFLTEIGVQRTDVMGWSMGGFVAQELLKRHDQRLRRVILAGTNPGGPRTKFGPKWAQRIDSDPNAGIDGYLATNYPRTDCAQQAGQASIRRVNRAITSGRYPQDRIPARTYRAMVRAEDPWYRSRDNLRALKQNQRRVWVITGVSDVVTPKENSRLLARALPRATQTLVRNAGHAFLFQDPKLVAAASLRFLRSNKPHKALPGRLSSDCTC